MGRTEKTKRYTSLQFSSVQFSSVQFSCSVQFSSVQFSSVQFSSVQFSSVQFSSVQFSSVQFNLFDIIESDNTYRHTNMYNQSENIIEKKIISLINSSDLIISVCFCGGTPNLVYTNRENPPQKKFFQINNIRHIVLIPEVCYRDRTRQNTPNFMKIISFSIYSNNDLLRHADSPTTNDKLDIRFN